jgi:Family of unknown function (DUF6130)
MRASAILITTIALGGILVTQSATQSAKDIRGSSPLITIENEPPARLIVDPPIPESLAAGRVFIQYRTENLRVTPVFGKGALQVSPRIGHIHITVDDSGLLCRTRWRHATPDEDRNPGYRGRLASTGY